MKDFRLLLLDSRVAFNRFICIKMGIGQLFDAQHFFQCSAAFPECFAGALKSLDVTHRNRAGRDATEASHGQVDLHRNPTVTLATRDRDKATGYHSFSMGVAVCQRQATSLPLPRARRGQNRQEVYFMQMLSDATKRLPIGVKAA